MQMPPFTNSMMHFVFSPISRVFVARSLLLKWVAPPYNLKELYNFHQPGDPNLKQVERTLHTKNHAPHKQQTMHFVYALPPILVCAHACIGWVQENCKRWAP